MQKKKNPCSIKKGLSLLGEKLQDFSHLGGVQFSAVAEAISVFILSYTSIFEYYIQVISFRNSKPKRQT